MAVTREALLDAFKRAGETDAVVGRVRFLGEGLYYRAYIAPCSVGEEDIDAVVRVPRTSAPDQDCAVERVNREVAVLRHLEGHGFSLRVPRMIATVPIGKRLAIVQTAVDGRPVEMRAPRGSLPRPWDAIAEAAAACHRLAGAELRDIIPTFQTWRQHAMHELQVLDQIDDTHVEAVRAWIQDHLPPDEPSVLIHGDLLGQNLQFSHEEADPLGVIDWHCAVIGDPAYDLAITTRGARRPFQTPSGMTNLLDAYAARTGRRLARAHIGLYELVLKARAYLDVEQDPASSREHAEHLRGAFASFARTLMSAEPRCGIELAFHAADHAKTHPLAMPIPAISTRGRSAPASPIRKLTPLADAARARGVTVHHLNIGQPDIATPRAMIEAYRNYDERVLAYAPSDGYRDYRDKLASYYSDVAADDGGAAEPVNADDIVVTVGGSEALMFAIAAVCDAGDAIVVCEPYYTNYAGFSHLLNVNVRAVTCLAEEGFCIDAARVAAAIDERTRALVLPSPGNPTGVVLSRAELSVLAEICREHGIFFICDEVYREFVYDGPPGSRAPSILSLADFADHAIVIDSVSKRYSACGARVGALITRNREVRDAALRFGQARLSPATVDQYAAMAALDTPASYFIDVVNEYRARRDALVEALHAIGVQCITPQGAFYLVATLPVDDADAFCRFLLTDFALDGETVMLAPASGFYASAGLGHNQARIAYVLDRPRLLRSVKILEAAFVAYRAHTAS